MDFGASKKESGRRLRNISMFPNVHKIMFRKVSKKPKAIQPRIQDTEDEQKEDHALMHERIRQTQRKHKLLASLPVATGDDKPKKRRFLVTGTTEEWNDDDDAQNLTVLAQKHKEAMDEYIEGQLNSTPGEINSKPQNEKVDPEISLYQELAAATVPSKVLTEDDAKGAMLVGGTGIAEVILPKNTELDDENRSGVRYSRNPKVSSAVSNPRMVKADLLPAGFRSMVPEKIPAKDSLMLSDASPMESSLVLPAVDDSRPGFAALLRKGKPRSDLASQPSGKPRGQHYEKDQQAFSKFVKRQREHGGKR